MKAILVSLLTLSGLYSFAGELTFKYSVTGHGKAPNFVRINYREVSIADNQCDYNNGRYNCKGEVSLTIVRTENGLNTIEFSSIGLSTEDIEARVYLHCQDRDIDLTPWSGISSRRKFTGQNSLYATADLDLSTVDFSSCIKN